METHACAVTCKTARCGEHDGEGGGGFVILSIVIGTYYVVFKNSCKYSSQCFRKAWKKGGGGFGGGGSRGATANFISSTCTEGECHFVTSSPLEISYFYCSIQTKPLTILNSLDSLSSGMFSSKDHHSIRWSPMAIGDQFLHSYKDISNFVLSLLQENGS